MAVSTSAGPTAQAKCRIDVIVWWAFSNTATVLFKVDTRSTERQSTTGARPTLRVTPETTLSPTHTSWYVLAFSIMWNETLHHTYHFVAQSFTMAAAGIYCLLLLLVWHAPLGVCGTKRRYQSPERTILSHKYRLIQGEIVRPQVLLDSLHPCSMRTSWWSPPVLWRGSSYDTPGICLVWHSRNVVQYSLTVSQHCCSELC